MSNLLDNLNEEQKQAVMHTNGPLLIIAGAGTGKTTVITKKIAYLIEQGLARPEEILALTFTDKAAGEMEERVDRLLPYGYVNLWISTFHSFCERILRERGIEIGLPEFKLLSDSGQWILLRKNLDKFNLDYYRPMGNPTKFIQALLKHFSRAKDEMITPEEYLELAQNIKLDGDSAEIIEDEKKKINEVAEAYHLYNRLLLEEGALDFGDLINYALKLFKTRPKILQEYRDKFKYILVDEFQDTNFVQYGLVKLLAAPNNNLTVVGDDDQSIYRFRGASMSNILVFDKDFPDAKKVVLTKNYRSGQKILDASYDFIKLNNPNRLECALGGGLVKKLESNAASSGEIILLSEESLEEEVAQVMKKILELKESDKECSWNDFAILTRSNDSAKPFIHQAELFGIPYQFLASRGLYGKPVISQIISFLKLLDNYRESAACYGFLMIPAWGITAYQIADLGYFSKKKAVSLYEACEHAELYSKDESLIKKLKEIIAFADKAREAARTKKPSQIIFAFLQDAGILKYYAAMPDGAEKRNAFNYLNKFYKKIKEFERENNNVSLKGLLELLELEMESGDMGALPHDPDEGPEMVKISTVHSAKGLEFKYVFVANLVDKRFPSIERSEAIEMPQPLIKEILPEGDIHLEEERRLFYVAMTRAKEKLFLSWGKDYGGARLKKPSRFLMELGLLETAEKQKNKEIAKQKMEIKTPEPEKTNKSEQILYSSPKHYSYSQLEAYEKCPYQYQLRHVLNVPAEGGYQASFGKSIHNTLQGFFIKIKECAGKSQNDLFGGKNQAVFPPLGELEKIYEKEWIGDWYESREAMEEYKKTGWEALKTYYETLKATPPATICMEQDFTLKFGENSFIGKIDRIDALPEGKCLIMDYKTGKPHDKLDFGDKVQLLVYYLVCREILKLRPEKLCLNYIIHNKFTEFSPSEKDLEKARGWVEKGIESIKSGNFNATPDERNCGFCDYRNICPNRL